MLNRSASSYFPNLGSNAVVQLIIVLGVAFVSLGLLHAVMYIVYVKPGVVTDAIFADHILSNIALGNIYNFPSHFWTLFTFGLFHNGFWELFSNMIWLYCFGSLVQMLIGYKQVIPIFLYSLLAGGVLYLLCQLIPGRFFAVYGLLMGPQAGIIGLAAAAITLSPQYRFYFTPTFAVPLYVVAGIFALFMVMNTGGHFPNILQLAGGGLMGFGYVRLLRTGYKPGDWMYNLAGRVEGLVTPDEHVAWKKNTKKRSEVLKNMQRKNPFTQTRIDDILDKINQHGYNSLTSEEKEILMRASKENK